MIRNLIATLLFVSFFVSSPWNCNSTAAAESQLTYAIVVSNNTQTDTDWAHVVTALQAKYTDRFNVSVIKWSEAVTESKEALATAKPYYTCFVATPTEANGKFVRTVHQLTRELDDDIYTDTIWAILTGFEPADALRIIAAKDQPVTNVSASTSVPLENFQSGTWYCELQKNRKGFKAAGQAPIVDKSGPDDTTHAIADAIDKSQLFITSGHASQRDWNIGYAYRNGRFVHDGAQLVGLTSTGQRFNINSTTPKSHLASGNCLIGDIDNPKGCMALALIHSAGVNQMVGYIVTTWFGYMGWGVQDYYTEQPGRFTLAEAFYANNQALTNRIYTTLPELFQEQTEQSAKQINAKAAQLDGATRSMLQGLIHDMNVVAIYGDPAWDNRVAPTPSGWEQTLTAEAADGNTNDGTIWTFTVTPLKGEKSFELLDPNGSQRGGRPVFAFLPKQISPDKVEIIEGAQLKPTITDNFILVPMEGFKTSGPTVIKFRAK